MTEFSISAPRGPLPVYVATPTTPGPWPGVVVLHDMLGMTQDLRNQADWLASEGFLAIAPNLLSRGGKVRCTVRAMRELIKRKGGVFEDAEACRLWLQEHEQCNGKLGVIGFCFGGGFAMLLAPSGGYDVASINYGTIPDDAKTFLASSCPIVASFGEKDGSLKGAATQLEKLLTELKIPFDIKEYPDTQHSFMNNHNKADIPWVFRVMSWLAGGSGYHAESAADARKRIVQFFRVTLQATPKQTTPTHPS